MVQDISSDKTANHQQLPTNTSHNSITIKREKAVKQILHEPVAAYFTSIYSTLMSVVLGAILAALALLLEKGGGATTMAKGAVCFLLAVLVWHRYVSHIQYVAWPLGVLDTIKPMLISASQVVAVYLVPQKQRITEFSMAITSTFILGFISYVYSYMRFNGPQSRLLFTEHFKEQGIDFAEEFQNEILDYHKLAMKWTAIISVILAITSAFVYLAKNWGWTNEERACIACTVFTVLILLMLFRYDLKWCLNKSEKQTIKKMKDTLGGKW